MIRGTERHIGGFTDYRGVYPGGFVDVRDVIAMLILGLRACLCDEWNDIVSIGGQLRPSACRIKWKWEPYPPPR